jgi:hypothetical protein
MYPTVIEHTNICSTYQHGYLAVTRVEKKYFRGAYSETGRQESLLELFY